MRGATVDLLEHPDPGTAAQAATVENLLRCWVRENDLVTPADGTLRIPLAATGTALHVPVHYWSATGWHRFGPPRLVAPGSSLPVDATTLAALLARETTAHRSTPGTEPRSAPGATGGCAPAGAPGAEPGSAPCLLVDLVGRVADSVRLTTTFVTDRREHPADGADLFLSAEQALLLGHPMHPTAKSRDGLSDTEAQRYSPELRGRFPLHWLAVAPSVIAADSAWTERGRRVPAGRLTERLA
ncbi:MAG: iron transporter, partial [Streptomyces sp.]|nr:iron transporter [Streptomyces sp.]